MKKYKEPSKFWIWVIRFMVRNILCTHRKTFKNEDNLEICWYCERKFRLKKRWNDFKDWFFNVWYY